jgi:hypothetical protein
MKTPDARQSSRDEAPRSGADVQRAGLRRIALIVAGMHRSGTSALTRVLSLGGGGLPEQLMGASEHNPKGYFESQRLYELHEALLEEAGTTWDDLSPFPRAWYDSPNVAVWVDRLRDAVRQEFGDAALLTVKDPRVCKLAPLWIEALRGLQIEPVFLLPVRNPLDVAASLRRAEGVEEAKATLLWLQYFLAAERDTRGHRRAFVSYDELLEDWRRVMARVEKDLGLVLPRASRRAQAEIDEFLARELRHGATRAEELDARHGVSAWVKQAYGWGLRAAAGELPDTGELDALGLAIEPAESAFGPVVASAELAATRTGEELYRVGAQLARAEAEGQELRGRLAERTEEAERLSERVAELEGQTRPLVEWVRSVLEWAGGLVGGGTLAKAHLEFALREIESTDLRAVPQLASAGLRLAQQAAEAARIAEEADLARAELSRSAAQLVALRDERAAQESRLAQLEAEAREREQKLRALERERDERAPELERLVLQRGQELEAAKQQLRGVWQQITARDGDLVAARRAAAASAAEAAGLRAEVAALRVAIGRVTATEAEWRDAWAARERDLLAAARELHALRGVAREGPRLRVLLREGSGSVVPGAPDPFLRRVSRVLAWTATGRLPARLRERIVVREIAASGLFDADWYRSEYPDIAGSKLDPATHFVRHGAAEGRRPSPYFDTRFYLDRYPDVAASGANPLMHYVRSGAAEGRDPNPHFDGAAYLAAHPDVILLGRNPLRHWLETRGVEVFAPTGSTSRGVLLQGAFVRPSAVRLADGAQADA